MLSIRLLTTNQAVGGSNLSGRAILYQINRLWRTVWPVFLWLSNRAINIHFIGQVLSLHAFPVSTASVIK